MLSERGRANHSATHILVIDGDQSLQGITFPGVSCFHTPQPHLDYGNTARAIGSIEAVARDFDAIAYLDADNWYEPDHLEQMVALHERTGAVVCTAALNLSI